MGSKEEPRLTWSVAWESSDHIRTIEENFSQPDLSSQTAKMSLKEGSKLRLARFYDSWIPFRINTRDADQSLQ
jgi:hypothetical protein